MHENPGNFKVGDHSIEIAYRRFLSDSAPGFIVIAIMIYKFYSYIEPLHEETKIFLYFLLFLLSTPLGLAINAVGYLFLDKLVHFIEELGVNIIMGRKWKRLHSLPKFIKSYSKTAAEDEFSWNECKKCFFPTNNKNDWISVTRRIMRIMDIYHHDRYHAHEHEAGIHSFLRSLAFIIAFIIIIIFICIIYQFVVFHEFYLTFHLYDFFRMPFAPSKIESLIFLKNIAIVHLRILFVYLYIPFVHTCILFVHLCILLVIFLLLLLSSAYVSYYYFLAMLCEAYNLCLQYEMVHKHPYSAVRCKNIDEIIEYLILTSERLRKEEKPDKKN